MSPDVSCTGDTFKAGRVSWMWKFSNLRDVELGNVLLHKSFFPQKSWSQQCFRRKAIDRDEWRRQSGLSCEACAQPARSYAAAAAASTIDPLLLLRNLSLSLKIDCKVKRISLVQYWALFFVQTAWDIILTRMTIGLSQRSFCKMAISWWDVLTQIPVFCIWRC